MKTSLSPRRTCRQTAVNAWSNWKHNRLITRNTMFGLARKPAGATHCSRLSTSIRRQPPNASLSSRKVHRKFTGFLRLSGPMSFIHPSNPLQQTAADKPSIPTCIARPLYTLFLERIMKYSYNTKVEPGKQRYSSAPRHSFEDPQDCRVYSPLPAPNSYASVSPRGGFPDLPQPLTETR